MDLSDLLTPQGVLAHLKVTGKKQLLQELAQRASPICGVADRLIFETLLERERLGTTGVGQGIAIPHGRLAGIEKIHGLFARLAEPVAFDAMDDLPVDLVFVLLAPESAGADHLKALARVSRLLRNPVMCEKLRKAGDTAALFALLTDASSSSQAA